MRRASRVERQRLHETFAALCRISSPTGKERPCTDWVAGELHRMGIEVIEDEAGTSAGSDSGNLLARVPARAQRWLMLCAHLDTVPPAGPIAPEFIDGGWVNARPGILGADNKAAVAVMLELARRLSGSAGEPPDTGSAGPQVGLELVFTVCEENGLHGAKAFDVTQLHSQFGYVFDHASPIGEIVLASPTYQRFTAELQGRAAHAGIRPEAGRNAIAAAANAISKLGLGRLDEHTTVNVGTISGGTAANVVPELCSVQGEVRGHHEPRVEDILTQLIDSFQDAADAAECDLDMTVERMFQGYASRSVDPVIRLAEQALVHCGYEPRHIITGGGSDANAFQAKGFACANLANGTERNHQPDERVSADALEGMLEVAIALHDQLRMPEVREI